MNVIRKEIHEYASRCAAEARKLSEEVDMDTQKMSIVEKEAEDFLKVMLHIHLSKVFEHILPLFHNICRLKFLNM